MLKTTTTLITTKTKPLAAALFAGAVLATGPAMADDLEAVDRGPYYEDDAWYDVTEWFDGNDYNPTDEVAGRWDDERYNAYEDTGSDIDNDWITKFDAWFGYDTRYGDDDWFYDYYDSGFAYSNDYQNDGVYDYTYQYFDYDADGNYDALYSAYDWNADGVFEDATFVSFNETGRKNKSRSDKTMSKDSKEAGVRGTVKNLKKVSVQDDKHLVARVALSDGKHRIVDLGPVSATDAMSIEEGDRLVTSGRISMIGDKHVLLAHRVEANGETATIDRSRREITGTIKDTRTIDVRGREHVIAVLSKSAKNDKTCAVDMGPKRSLPANLSKGTKVTVEGVPVKVNDRRMMMATAFTRNGNTVDIDRRMSEQSRSMNSQSNRSDRNGGN